jgi:hypothetical protein
VLKAQNKISKQTYIAWLDSINFTTTG